MARSVVFRGARGSVHGPSRPGAERAPLTSMLPAVETADIAEAVAIFIDGARRRGLSIRHGGDTGCVEGRARVEALRPHGRIDGLDLTLHRQVAEPSFPVDDPRAVGACSWPETERTTRIGGLEVTPPALPDPGVAFMRDVHARFFDAQHSLAETVPAMEDLGHSADADGVAIAPPAGVCRLAPLRHDLMSGDAQLDEALHAGRRPAVIMREGRPDLAVQAAWGGAPLARP